MAEFQERNLSDDYDNTPETLRLRALEREIESSMPPIEELRGEFERKTTSLEKGSAEVPVNIKARRVQVIHSLNGNIVTFDNQEELDILRYKDGLAAKENAAASKEEVRSQFDFDEEED